MYIYDVHVGYKLIVIQLNSPQQILMLSLHSIQSSIRKLLSSLSELMQTRWPLPSRCYQVEKTSTYERISRAVV